jgi:hypothetical protein
MKSFSNISNLLTVGESRERIFSSGLLDKFSNGNHIFENLTSFADIGVSYENGIIEILHDYSSDSFLAVKRIIHINIAPC